MAKKSNRKTTLDLEPIEKVFRFYGYYNNISIGPKIHLNGVKIILHEVRANTLDEAYELYKLHLIHNVGVSEDDVKQYLIDLYYKTILVEVVDTKTTTHTQISLIDK